MSRDCILFLYTILGIVYYLYFSRRVARRATPAVALRGMTVTSGGTAAGLGSM